MAATHFSGPVVSDNGFVGSLLATPVLLPNSDLALTAEANAGRINITPDVSADRTYTLPAPSAGLYFQFVYGGSAADGHDFIISTGANARFFKGNITFLDSDAGAAGDEVVPVFPNGSTHSKLQVNLPEAAQIHVLGIDGTNWQIWGTVTSTTAPAFATQ
jgi:hypothetical protein